MISPEISSVRGYTMVNVNVPMNDVMEHLFCCNNFGHLYSLCGRPSEGAGPLKKAEVKIKQFLKLRFTTKHKWRTICPKKMQMSIVLPRQETNTSQKYPRL